MKYQYSYYYKINASERYLLNNEIIPWQYPTNVHVQLTENGTQCR